MRQRERETEREKFCILNNSMCENYSSFATSKTVTYAVVDIMANVNNELYSDHVMIPDLRLVSFEKYEHRHIIGPSYCRTD